MSAVLGNLLAATVRINELYFLNYIKQGHVGTVRLKREIFYLYCMEMEMESIVSTKKELHFNLSYEIQTERTCSSAYGSYSLSVQKGFSLSTDPPITTWKPGIQTGQR